MKYYLLTILFFIGIPIVEYPDQLVFIAGVAFITFCWGMADILIAIDNAAYAISKEIRLLRESKHA